MSDVSKLYDISFEKRERYLFALITGNTSKPETKVACWAEIIKYCREIDADRLLVTLDGPGNTSEADAFESSRDIVALGLTGIKISYVDPDPANLPNNQFGELVAENRGAFARVFTAEKEAEEWLLSKRR